MKTGNRENPACFGSMEHVFPKGADGLRQTPERCLNCPHKVGCLRAAVSGPDGIRVREEVLDRAYHTGVVSFFERWSKKKHFQKQLQNDPARKG